MPAQTNSNLRFRLTKLNKLLTDQPNDPVGILLHVLTLPQVQQAAGPRCSLLRGVQREGAPQVQDQEGGRGTGFKRGGMIHSLYIFKPCLTT